MNKSIQREGFAARMNNDAVVAYRAILNKKKCALFFKRAFDIAVSLLLLLILSPAILIISVMIKADSPGSIIFRQERITKNGKPFYIYKFRTMVQNAEALGSQVTVDHDMRITRVGSRLRRCRLDEILQLLNILKGDMTFVGTRPEVRKYVEAYSDEMLATLLLPAGVTSLASICYKDEGALLKEAANADETYINEILPKKMKYNLEYIKCFGFWYDIKIMLMTVLAVCGVDFAGNNAKDKEEVKIGG